MVLPLAAAAQPTAAAQQPAACTAAALPAPHQASSLGPWLRPRPSWQQCIDGTASGSRAAVRAAARAPSALAQQEAAQRRGCRCWARLSLQPHRPGRRRRQAPSSRISGGSSSRGSSSGRSHSRDRAHLKGAQQVVRQKAARQLPCSAALRGLWVQAALRTDAGRGLRLT